VSLRSWLTGCLTPAGRGRGGRQRSLASIVGQILGSVARGRLSALPFAVALWDGSELPAATATKGPVVTASVRAVPYLLRQPNELGLARAWVTGALDLDGDLEDVLVHRDRFASVSLSLCDRARVAAAGVRIMGPAVLLRAPVVDSEARIIGRLHSVHRDRAAVGHHYELPAAFYRLLLGPTVVYSCAYFERPDETLKRAQRRKLEVICRKLQLRTGDRLLDIGCGWGSLVMHAAAEHGVRAVGVTASVEQAIEASARIRQAGLTGRCEVRAADYREVNDGPYDAIASVGMYEHVGRDQLTNYTAAVAALLRPGGAFLNHGIARLSPGPTHDRTFIRRFVFPDGDLHPVTDVLHALEAAGLEIRDVESLREHYPLTLRHWAANLDRSRERAVQLVGAERERIWRLYLIASALAFERGELSVFQVLTTRPGARHRLPLSRGRTLARDRPPGLPARASTHQAQPPSITAATGRASDRPDRSPPATRRSQ